MNDPTTHSHTHDDFPIPPETVANYTQYGGVDTALLNRLITASMDGCAPCQSPLLDRIGHLPATVAKLAEISANFVVNRFGGLPRNMTDPNAPGVSSAEYRRAIGAGIDRHEQGVYTTVEALTPQRRRAVAEDALELIVGYLSAPPLSKLLDALGEHDD